MEQEFKRTGLPGGGPSYSKLLIQGLRKAREEHPVLDFAAGNLPIVGGLQAGMDATDPEASPVERGLSALSFVPGGKMLSKILPDKLRGKVSKMVEEQTYSPEEIFQAPDIKMDAAQRARSLAAQNAEAKKIAEQYLKDEADGIVKTAEQAGQKLYGGRNSGLVFDPEYRELSYKDLISQDGGGPFFDEYEYAFHPSSGKGFDVSSTPFSNKHLDKDGNLYIGGATGVSKITGVPDNAQIKKDYVKYMMEQQGFDEASALEDLKLHKESFDE